MIEPGQSPTFVRPAAADDDEPAYPPFSQTPSRVLRRAVARKLGGPLLLLVWFQARSPFKGPEAGVLRGYQHARAAADLGYSQPTIERWFRALRKTGLVRPIRQDYAGSDVALVGAEGSSHLMSPPITSDEGGSSKLMARPIRSDGATRRPSESSSESLSEGGTTTRPARRPGAPQPSPVGAPSGSAIYRARFPDVDLRPGFRDTLDASILDTDQALRNWDWTCRVFAAHPRWDATAIENLLDHYKKGHFRKFPQHAPPEPEPAGRPAPPPAAGPPPIEGPPLTPEERRRRAAGLQTFLRDKRGGLADLMRDAAARLAEPVEGAQP